MYCAAETKVTNSRLQQRTNQVWRRRVCQVCGNAFTTHELADLGSAVVVQAATGHVLQPFSRDRLFLSIYNSCKHRATAVSDATHLTQTVIDLLRPHWAKGSLTRDEITTLAHQVLERFDPTAATVYAAYHRTAV